MKKEFLLAIAAFFFMSASAITGVYAVEQEQKPGIKTISKKRVDVTGDGLKDTVYLKGIPFDEGALFLKEVFLEISASDRKMYRIDLEGGYEPKITFKDLKHDKIKDLFVDIPTGGSGGLSNFYLYSLKDFTVTDLTVPEPLATTSQFDDGYKASLKIDETGEAYTFDLSSRKADYDRIGLYHNGKLNEPTELMVLPYGTLKPVKVSGNQYGLKGVQRVSGAYNADGIAYLQSTWNFENGKWNLIDATLKKMLPRKNK
ncbi:hypothetical protein [Bacillus sp. T33-2]|uniref:hypothetical protein n=1 Tax=Bacillus sp. T33-2 TaxID=2054168 RepID=UPI000C772502|nr:hypothetical protein [Bacillus sp. T33-2]PLR95272.1 hypothetical protein CVD19_14970 [Bacillus sp. T33-2]